MLLKEPSVIYRTSDIILLLLVLTDSRSCDISFILFLVSVKWLSTRVAFYVTHVRGLARLLQLVARTKHS